MWPAICTMLTRLQTSTQHSCTKGISHWKQESGGIWKHDMNNSRKSAMEAAGIINFINMLPKHHMSGELEFTTTLKHTLKQSPSIFGRHA